MIFFFFFFSFVDFIALPIAFFIYVLNKTALPKKIHVARVQFTSRVLPVCFPPPPPNFIYKSRLNELIDRRLLSGSKPNNLFIREFLEQGRYVQPKGLAS